MIGLEQRTEMRRLYYAEHWTAGTIASALGVHRDAVLHAIESERFQMRGGRPRESGLDLYLPFIRGALEQYPRLGRRCAASAQRQIYITLILRIMSCSLTNGTPGRASNSLHPSCVPTDKQGISIASCGARRRSAG